MLSIKDKATRTLLIKMGKLCEFYEEPYDSTDREIIEYNDLLETKLQICWELLEELSA